MMAAGAPHYDLGRWGMEVFRASPRQADLMIVAGRVSQKMAPVLRQIYDQMAEPKWVLSMGVCASSGGMFNNYAIVQGVDHVVPVDMYLPGCPPRPEMLIDAILKLREKIMHEPLGAERAQDARGAQRARATCRSSRPGAMPSSYRSDPERRRQWEKAVREGREEQLRIENWMKPTAATSQGGGERESELAALTTEWPNARRYRSASPPVGADQRRRRPSCRRPARPGRGMFGIQRLRRHLRLRRPGPPPARRWSTPRARTAATSTTCTTRWRRRSPGCDDAIEKVVVDRGELTLHIGPERIAEVCRACATTSRCGSSCAPRCPVWTISARTSAGCTSSYHLTSMTYRRRVRLEVAVTAENPRLPSVTSVYPTADWQERETYDMFGVVFDGHPNLTRILMPDDWEGHPQRKDYPLGGVPVEYKGAEIPPPDQRRVYQ